MKLKFTLHGLELQTLAAAHSNRYTWKQMQEKNKYGYVHDEIAFTDHDADYDTETLHNATAQGWRNYKLKKL